MSSNERQARIDQLFLDAVNLSRTEREAFLDKECAGDLELQREVEDLLDSDEQLETGFIATGPINVGMFTEPEEARTGEQIGPYLLRERIASGGFGTVYRAVREQPYYEQVAIKLLHADKVESQEIVQRSIKEMQALSDLRHEYIVAQLQSGLTNRNEPYIVMELVDGQALGTYCDENRLSVHDRLKLFQKICDAVQFAHDNNWIHRDLKPGNILVAKDGTPKLLDFGIAKLVKPRTDWRAGNVATALTMSPIGTPQYMSPEQMLGQRVGKPSDIFSLGIILYELVSGHRMSDVLCGNTDSYRFDQLQQAVQNTTPIRPSDMVEIDSTCGESSETISFRRNTSPMKLRQSLSGDVDNIVMMAVRREPERRYASPRAMSEDIQAWLEHRPVSAQPDSFKYKLHKWWRRNSKTVAWTTTFVLGVGLAGLLAWKLSGVISKEKIDSAIKSVAQEKTLSLVRKGQTAIDRDDYQSAVECFYDAHLSTSDQLKQSYARLVQAWSTYLGFPLAANADVQCAFSPAGDRVAVSLPTGEVRIWDLTNRRILGTFDAGGFASHLHFSPDGEEIGVQVGDNRFHVCSPEGKQLADVELDATIAAMWRDDDGWSVLCIDDSNLIKTEIREGVGTERSHKPLPTGWTYSRLQPSQIIPHQGLVLVALADSLDPQTRPNTKAELRRATDLEFVCDLPELPRATHRVSPDGSTIAFSTSSATVLFDVLKREQKAKLDGEFVGMNADGERVLFTMPDGNERQLAEWHTGVTTELATIPAENITTWRHAAGHAGVPPHLRPKQPIQLRQVGEKIESVRALPYPMQQPPAHGEYRLLECDPSGQHVFLRQIRSDTRMASQPTSLGEQRLSAAWIWNTEPFQIPGSTTVDHPVKIMATSETGKLTAFAQPRGVEIWNAEEATWQTVRCNNAFPITAIAIHEQSDLLIAGTANGELFRWTLTSAQSTVPFAKQEQPIKDLRLSHLGDRLLSTTLQDSKVYPLTDDRENSVPASSSFVPMNGTFSSAKFSDGNSIIVNSGAEILHLTSRLSTQPDRSLAIANGRTIAYGEFDGTVVAIILHGDDGMQVNVQTNKSSRPLDTPKGRRVTAAAMAPKGEVFVLGYDNGTLQFWDTYSAERISLPSLAGTASIDKLLFSQDGDTLVSLSKNGEVFRWRTFVNQTWSTPEDLKNHLELICGSDLESEQPVRTLTDAQWQRHFEQMIRRLTSE